MLKMVDRRIFQRRQSFRIVGILLSQDLLLDAQDIFKVIHAQEPDGNGGRNIRPKLGSADLVVVDLPLSPQNFQVFRDRVASQAELFRHFFHLETGF